MSTPQLDRLLFAQGGRCFFCQQPLPRSEASIEHLVASANGGKNSEDNCVACCRTLNSLFGSKSIKEKLQIVLNQRGVFHCPRITKSASTSTSRSESSDDQSNQPNLPKPSVVEPCAPASAVVAARDTHQLRLDLVLDDLRKRGNARPRKEATLVATIQALIKQRTNQPISDANLRKLLIELQQFGQVLITEGKVTYRL